MCICADYDANTSAAFSTPKNTSELVIKLDFHLIPHAHGISGSFYILCLFSLLFGFTLLHERNAMLIGTHALSSAREKNVFNYSYAVKMRSKDFE